MADSQNTVIPPATEQHPALPPRHEQQEPLPAYNPQDYAHQSSSASFPPPPQRQDLEHHDPSSPIYYARDPKKLVGYLVPFPTPKLHDIPTDRVPPRFLIYTPPPPPLHKPVEGEKEGRIHKVQRKWQEEVREAKTSQPKKISWRNFKGKATMAINWGIGHTTNSNLDFLNRVAGTENEAEDMKAKEDAEDDLPTKNTVMLEEMLLVHPTSVTGTNQQLREEFVNTMLRTKSKAERDSIIATGLLPVGAAIDILATLIWPFGGLLEIDAVWLYASIQGVKTSRSVTKRLASSSTNNDLDKDRLQLNFVPSPQLEVLSRYLAAECHRRDSKHFASPGTTPTESEVLEAIAWTPSSKGGEDRNWEDEAWESQQVKDDLKTVMSKGAKEWDKWCKMFEKSPEKALKK